MGQQGRTLDPQVSPAAFFGVRLRAWRQARGLSQLELGRRVHVSGDLISKIERAERRATSDLVSRTDAALGADGELLQAGVALREEARGSGGGPHWRGLGDSPGREADSTLPPVLSGLRDVLAGCRLLDHALGSQAILATITTQVGIAETLLPVCGAAYRDDLLGLLAELHQFGGWLAFDQGHVAAAGRAFTAAVGHARAAGSSELTAFVLGPSHGFTLTYSGRPDQGVRLGQAALGHALHVDNPRLTAFVRATTARAHARLGEHSAALRLLDEAEADLSRADAAEPAADWLTVFDAAALHGHRGSCLLDLGRSAVAVEELATQDDTAPRCFARNRTIWLLDRARAHLDQRDLPATCQVLAQALPQTMATSSRRVQARLLTYASALTPHRGNADVAALLDQLHASRVA